MGDVLEGYLQKKAGNITARWLKRYYHFHEGEKKLIYWQKQEHKTKNQPPKGEIKADEIEKVYPDPDKRDKFTLVMKNKSTVFRAERDEADKWVRGISKFVKQDSKLDTGYVDDEDTASWTTEQIVEMMNTGQVMTAYFSNNTKKNFTLYCKDLVLYACPVNQGIDKAIINLPLRRISDIYVGKQTPGFDTEVAAPVPFDRCFTIISRKYTLDVEAKSYQMATHWLAGIKYLLTMSGKAVIVNEQEATGAKPAEETNPNTQDGGKGAESTTPAETTTDVRDNTGAAEAAAEEAVRAAKAIQDHSADENGDLELELSQQEDEAKGKRKSALLIIDVQNDFLPPEGSLAVKDGLEVIPVINKLHRRVEWSLVAVSQDWHPANHISFFLNNKDNPKAKLLEVLVLPDGREQMMWPAHCVQLSKGAEFHHELVLEVNDKFVRKGTKADVDSYSAFFDNDHKTKTELSDILRKANITDVVITGLAYDYCVGYTALDAVKEGFRTYVVEDATRGVLEDTVKKMKHQLREAGVSIVTADQIQSDGSIPDNADAKDADEKEDGDEKAPVDEDGESDTDDPAPTQPTVPVQLGVDDFLSQKFLVDDPGKDTSHETTVEKTPTTEGSGEETVQSEEHTEDPEPETEPETTEEPKPEEKTTDTKDTQPKKPVTTTTPKTGATKPAGTGAKPTGTGAKPTGTGAKPTGTGAKPTGTGAKPTGTGAKPTGTGAKPTGTGAKPGQPGAKPGQPGAKPKPGDTKAKPGDTKAKPGVSPGAKKPSGPVKIHAVPPKPVKKPVGKPGPGAKKPVPSGAKTPGKPGPKPGTTPGKPKPTGPGAAAKPGTPGTNPAKKPTGAGGSPTKPGVKKPDGKDGKTDGKTATKPADGKTKPGVTSPTTTTAKKPGAATTPTTTPGTKKPTTPGTAPAKPGTKPAPPKTPSTTSTSSGSTTT